MAAKRNSKMALAAWKMPILRLVLIDSRVLYIILLQFMANLIFPDHDADAFKGVAPDSPGALDAIVFRVFGGLRRWDSVHFLHVAEWGYVYETDLAFFPLYSIVVGLIWKVVGILVPLSLLSDSGGLLLCGVLVNLVCFMGAAHMLFLLSISVYGHNSTIPTLAVVLFAINPASIFFSSCYSESLYSLLTFLGLYCIHAKRKGSSDVELELRSIFESCGVFGLALLCRSNGLLNCIFVAFAFVQRLTRERTVVSLLSNISYGLMCAVVILTPYAYLQHFIFRTFCTSHVLIPPQISSIGLEHNLTMAGQISRMPWCSQYIPISYGYIQNHYWNVGLFQYYQIRKIPCFILATPIIVIACASLVYYLSKLRPPKKVSCLSYWFKKDSNKLIDDVLYLPYVLHLLITVFTGVFLINVEVLTRIIFSSNPLIYWYLAELLCCELRVTKSQLEKIVSKERLWAVFGYLWRQTDVRGKMMLGYCIAYGVLGTVMHVNWLPWT